MFTCFQLTLSKDLSEKFFKGTSFTSLQHKETSHERGVTVIQLILQTATIRK